MTQEQPGSEAKTSIITCSHCGYKVEADQKAAKPSVESVAPKPEGKGDALPPADTTATEPEEQTEGRNDNLSQANAVVQRQSNRYADRYEDDDMGWPEITDGDAGDNWNV